MTEERDYKPPYPLVGVAEAAVILGVSKQRVDQLRREGRMPTPVAVLAATTVWNRADVEEYAKKPRPSGRPLTGGATPKLPEATATNAPYEQVDERTEQ